MGGVLFAADLGWHVFASDAANLVLTIGWLLGVINAFNLMDNMDGAAGTVAALSSVGTAILALTVHEISIAVLAVALCGACLGFLPYNLSSPARIFLGDGGSMPVGFLVAAAIMAVPLHGAVGWHRLLVAVLLVALPVLDTTLVMVMGEFGRTPKISTLSSARSPSRSSGAAGTTSPTASGPGFHRPEPLP